MPPTDSDHEFGARLAARVDALERELQALKRATAEQTAKLDEMLMLLKASKLSLGFLRACITLGLGVGTLYAAFRGLK
jgi:phage terminase large subunit-like protein